MLTLVPARSAHPARPLANTYQRSCGGQWAASHLVTWGDMLRCSASLSSAQVRSVWSWCRGVVVSSGHSSVMEPKNVFSSYRRLGSHAYSADTPCHRELYCCHTLRPPLTFLVHNALLNLCSNNYKQNRVIHKNLLIVMNKLPIKHCPKVPIFHIFAMRHYAETFFFF